ncbi:MAG: type I glyceraldehyde-3-phosphate dehydrogenase [Parcubacteria group bacterium RIFOXYD2_FULL_52_8]|nr:MAG: type I glyceraldehyde-3-phosphate dehydrogenase [Parcubacteria group bacterium RIFOXYD2_FULL_52_8]
MKTRVAINGFGRIGRLFYRQVAARDDLEVVAVNDLGDLENLAYLLKYDSVYGTFRGAIKVDKAAGTITVDGQVTKVLQVKDPAQLPWGALQIDIVIEATGLYESFEKAKVHLNAGAKHVVLTAPAKDDEGVAGGKTILMGVNDAVLSTCAISSNASCTTNSAASVMQILSENPGIEKAMLSTVHAMTTTQSIVDSPVKGGNDFRRGRASSQNIVPSATGAAIAVTRAVPALEHKFDGIAFRIPTVAGSLSDITFVSKRRTSVEEINDILIHASGEERWKGILKVTRDQVVSSDILGEPYGAIVDLSFTKVVDGNLVKVLSWYDNEWGYTATLVRHVIEAAKHL